MGQTCLHHELYQLWGGVRYLQGGGDTGHLHEGHRASAASARASCASCDDVQHDYANHDEEHAKYEGVGELQ